MLRRTLLVTIIIVVRSRLKRLIVCWRVGSAKRMMKGN